MNSLRRLDVESFSGFEYPDAEICRNAFLKALWLNTSLERTCCLHSEYEVDEDYEVFEDIISFGSKLAVPLSLNQGGRGALQNQSINCFPRGLWVLVYKRAMTPKYYDVSDECGYPTRTPM
ncbi:unnamed protein product [Cylindrotheca closterium]|uniref:Uncharacterized protein n=1 Tax=Cylindrotheca closterium TaxID=2856 RepID=A0AAD2JHJ3_9STRA|nr:unnamed protein product [Cylindrotheca closterium]